MLYMGEITPQGSEPMLNLDMAKYQVDVLGILEEKTQNNLTPDERHLLDSALLRFCARDSSISRRNISERVRGHSA